MSGGGRRARPSSAEGAGAGAGGKPIADDAGIFEQERQEDSWPYLLHIMADVRNRLEAGQPAFASSRVAADAYALVYNIATKAATHTSTVSDLYARYNAALAAYCNSLTAPNGMPQGAEAARAFYDKLTASWAKVFAYLDRFYVSHAGHPPLADCAARAWVNAGLPKPAGTEAAASVGAEADTGAGAGAATRVKAANGEMEE